MKRTTHDYLIKAYEELRCKRLVASNNCDKSRITNEMIEITEILDLCGEDFIYEYYTVPPQDYYLDNIYKYKSISLQMGANASQLLEQYDTEYSDFDGYQKTPIKTSIKLARHICYQFSSSLGELFDQMLLDEDIIFNHMEVIEIAGMTYHFPDLDKTLIIINYENNIYDVVSIIHELMHAYIFKSNKIESDPKHNFVELLPRFFELHGLNLLKEENVIDSDKCIQSDLFFFLSAIEHNSKELKKDNPVIDNLNTAMNYAYASACGTIIYEKYINDPEDTMNKINKFIEMFNTITFLETLELFNISLADIESLAIFKKLLKIEYPKKVLTNE